MRRRARRVYFQSNDEKEIRRRQIATASFSSGKNKKNRKPCIPACFPARKRQTSAHKQRRREAGKSVTCHEPARTLSVICERTWPRGSLKSVPTPHQPGISRWPPRWVTQWIRWRVTVHRSCISDGSGQNNKKKSIKRPDENRQLLYLDDIRRRSASTQTFSRIRWSKRLLAPLLVCRGLHAQAPLDQLSTVAFR